MTVSLGKIADWAYWMCLLLDAVYIHAMSTAISALGLSQHVVSERIAELHHHSHIIAYYIYPEPYVPDQKVVPSAVTIPTMGIRERKVLAISK